MWMSKMTQNQKWTFSIIAIIGDLLSAFRSICLTRGDWRPPCDRSRCRGPAGRWRAICRHTSSSDNRPAFCRLWTYFGCSLTLCWSFWFRPPCFYLDEWTYTGENGREWERRTFRRPCDFVVFGGALRALSGEQPDKLEHTYSSGCLRWRRPDLRMEKIRGLASDS